MASFQMTTLKIAGIVLLIFIILLAVILYFPSNSQVWPPIIPNCPDYFQDVNGDGSLCINAYDLGSPKVGSENFSVAPYIGTNGNCEKYNWATAHQLTWDGITYGVQNPCELLNN